MSRGLTALGIGCAVALTVAGAPTMGIPAVVTAACGVGEDGDAAAAHARTDAWIAERAARLDARLDVLRGAPVTPVDEHVFARRAYLEVLGRIPDLDELTAFLDQASPDRRARLIERLLDAPGHRSHLANVWADRLRARDTLSRGVSGEPLRHWIRAALEERRRYDAMVAELLVATGPAHAPGNGATGLLLRDAGMLEDGMANTVRAFLGARIECAQCHDHPYEAWTQREYLGMVAFTGGVQTELPLRDLPGGADLLELRDAFVDEHGRLARGAFRRAVRPLHAGVSGTGTGQITTPDDALQHAGETVRATTLTGEVLGPEPRTGRRGRRRRPEPVDSRQALADWITGDPGGRFARNIANREWARLMGRGVVEPLDESWSAPARDEPLMLELEELVRAADYDLDLFGRVVMGTAAWAAPARPPDDELAGLVAPALRRLSAEQVWDSLLVLVVPDLDDLLGPALTDGAREVYEQYEAARADPVAAVSARLQTELRRLTDAEAWRAERRALAKARRVEERAEQDVVRDRARPLGRALARAERRGDASEVATLRAQLAELGVTSAARAARRGLLRASELEQPAPPDHLLARFGQGDREQPDGGRLNDDLPQVLALLNGFVEQELLGQDRAALWEALDAAPSAEVRLERAWLAVLSRAPTEAERALWSEALAADPEVALRDLVWCLVNGLEFVFRP